MPSIEPTKKRKTPPPTPTQLPSTRQEPTKKRKTPPPTPPTPATPPAASAKPPATPATPPATPPAGTPEGDKKPAALALAPAAPATPPATPPKSEKHKQLIDFIKYLNRLPPSRKFAFHKPETAPQFQNLKSIFDELIDFKKENKLLDFQKTLLDYVIHQTYTQMISYIQDNQTKTYMKHAKEITNTYQSAQINETIQNLKVPIYNLEKNKSLRNSYILEREPNDTYIKKYQTLLYNSFYHRRIKVITVFMDLDEWRPLPIQQQSPASQQGQQQSPASQQRQQQSPASQQRQQQRQIQQQIQQPQQTNTDNTPGYRTHIIATSLFSPTLGTRFLSNSNGFPSEGRSQKKEDTITPENPIGSVYSSNPTIPDVIDRIATKSGYDTEDETEILIESHAKKHEELSVVNYKKLQEKMKCFSVENYQKDTTERDNFLMEMIQKIGIEIHGQLYRGVTIDEAAFNSLEEGNNISELLATDNSRPFTSTTSYLHHAVRFKNKRSAEKRHKVVFLIQPEPAIKGLPIDHEKMDTGLGQHEIIVSNQSLDNMTIDRIYDAPHNSNMKFVIVSASKSKKAGPKTTGEEE